MVSFPQYHGLNELLINVSIEIAELGSEVLASHSFLKLRIAGSFQGLKIRGFRG